MEKKGTHENIYEMWNKLTTPAMGQAKEESKKQDSSHFYDTCSATEPKSICTSSEAPFLKVDQSISLFSD